MISDISSSAKVYTDLNGLAELKNQAREQSPEALREVAKQFESVFLQMMLKSMRDASLGEGLMENDQTQFYRDLYDKQLAIHLSEKSGIGLADMIVEQMGGKPEATGKSEVGLDVSRLLSTQSVAGQKTAAIKVTVDSADITNEPRIDSADAFVNVLMPYAKDAAKRLGVDPNLLVAQAALETGWGQHVIQRANGGSSHNLFNIKAGKNWEGSRAMVDTLEYEDGVAVKKRDGFRAYGSYQESFDDYVALLETNPKYSRALKHADDPEEYINALQDAGYATDPRYGEKVMTIYQGKLTSANNS